MCHQLRLTDEVSHFCVFHPLVISIVLITLNFFSVFFFHPSSFPVLIIVITIRGVVESKCSRELVQKQQQQIWNESRSIESRKREEDKMMTKWQELLFGSLHIVSINVTLLFLFLFLFFKINLDKSRKNFVAFLFVVIEFLSLCLYVQVEIS